MYIITNNEDLPLYRYACAHFWKQTCYAQSSHTGVIYDTVCVCPNHSVYGVVSLKFIEVWELTTYKQYG